MISDHIDVHFSVAPVRLIQYTIRPILPMLRCLCITQSACMVLVGYKFFRTIQSAAHSASHLCTELGIPCWMLGYRCSSAHDESQPWKLYFATLGLLLSVCGPRDLPHQLQVAYCLAFPFSSPPEPQLHISLWPSLPIVAESIRHCWNFAKVAWYWKSPKNL